MKTIEHWSGAGSLTVAESVGGVLATQDPWDNLMRGTAEPWPPPELIQKLYASDKWRGRSSGDDASVRTHLGYYCDLQSLNSEDAVTWSFFGPLVYSNPEVRSAVARAILAKCGISASSGPATFWLWRRVPHPEKPGSTGGPEIDFGIQLHDTFVLGEAKWNSRLALAQGVHKNRSQLDLRVAYCREIAPKAMPQVRSWVILGLARTSELLGAPGGANACEQPRIASLTWHELALLYPDPPRHDLLAYLNWKERHSLRTRAASV